MLCAWCSSSGWTLAVRQRVAERVRERLDPVAVGEEALIRRAGVEDGHDHVVRRSAALDDLHELAERAELLDAAFELVTLDFGARRPARRRRDSTARLISQASSARSSRMKVSAAPALRPEQRRLRDEHVAVVDELAHLAVEERQQQRPDVRSVDVRVGHDDDAVVAQLRDVEVFLADAASQRGDHRFDLVAAEHLVEARAFDVEDLSLDREDCLEARDRGPAWPSRRRTRPRRCTARSAPDPAPDSPPACPAGLLLSSAPLRRTRSRAFRAASRARAASTALLMTRFATAGFSSRYAPSRSLRMASTMPLTSVLPSFVFVWPSNCGRGIFTLTTAVRPSRMSSPPMFASFRSFARLFLLT